jgi:hypothetical protein
LLIREWIRGQGIRSEPVRTGTFGDVPDQENDGADQRDKADQNPPARAVKIMQAPNADGDAGNEGDESEKSANELCVQCQVDDAVELVRGGGFVDGDRFGDLSVVTKVPRTALCGRCAGSGPGRAGPHSSSPVPVSP